MKPLGIIEIKKAEQFKKRNLNEWKKNSYFWLKGKMKHIKDVKDTTISLIKEQIDQKQSENINLLDIGCGEGWLLRALLQNNVLIKYTGLDFNKAFINSLNKKYFNNDNISFLFHDLENIPDKSLFNSADIIVNAFNFFEIPNLSMAFKYTSKMLKNEGILLIITIDPIMQLLAISNTKNEFMANFEKYSVTKYKLGYKKNIVVGKKKSRKTYLGILYSLSEYFDLAKRNNLEYIDYKELVQPEEPTPQIYQFLIFKKNEFR